MAILSGQRHLVLEAASGKEFDNWASAVKKALKSVGADVDDKHLPEFPDKMEKNLSTGLEKMGLHLTKRPSNHLSKKGGDIDKIRAENNQIRTEITQFKAKMTELTAQLERMEREKEKTRSGEKELREKKWREFQKAMEEREDEHTRQMQELEKSIEDLQCKIEEKNRSEGFFKVGVLFGDGFDKEDQTDVHQTEQQVSTGETRPEMKIELVPEKKEEQKYNDDGILEDYQEDTQMTESTYKVTYKHQHKHNHIHILNHRHTHYHNDTADKPVTYTQTETLAHTIVHTFTQFQIKRNVLS